MKFRFGLALAVMTFMGTAPQAVMAQHRDLDRGRGPAWGGDIRHFEGRDLQHWRSGYWQRANHGGRLGWWWVIGGLWYFYPQPVYPYPDPFRPPVVVVQPSAPVVTVPTAPVVVEQVPQQVWYYCEASASYYPYVASCPGGWKTVPATPAGSPQ
jgi:hypothetical protein